MFSETKMRAISRGVEDGQCLSSAPPPLGLPYFHRGVQDGILQRIWGMARGNEIAHNPFPPGRYDQGKKRGHPSEEEDTMSDPKPLDFSHSAGYDYTEGFTLTADGDMEAPEERGNDWYMFLGGGEGNEMV